MSFIRLAALAALVLVCGCLSGPSYSYQYSISDPYDISSGVIEMKVNTTAYVLINNSAGGDLRFTVENATLTANQEDGTTQAIQGYAEGGSVPAGGQYMLNVSFNGVPVRYVMIDSPPRFHSVISSYDVNVTSSGQTKILIFWTPAVESANNMRIPMNDMPVGDYLSKLKEGLKAGG